MRYLYSDDKVAHVMGSSRGKGEKISWKQYWTAKSPEDWPYYCQMENCYQQAVLGAHIYVRGRGWQNYIMPCCQDCNNNSRLHYHGRDSPNWSSPEDGTIVVEAPNSGR